MPKSDFFQYESKNIDDLSGCINDAESIREFLEVQFKVPPRRIRLLTNAEANRQQILDVFRSHLIENEDIERGDAIFFYFAGHGSRVGAPEGWETRDGKVETFCPHDERTEKDSKKVEGIPYWEVIKLFRHLAAVKGDNIVGVFSISKLCGHVDDPLPYQFCSLQFSTRTFLAV